MDISDLTADHLTDAMQLTLENIDVLCFDLFCIGNYHMVETNGTR